MISSVVLRQFKEELWKDQRGLEVIERNGLREALIKHYENTEEAACEQEVLRHLHAYMGPGVVPELLECGPLSSTIRYVYGIRVFNLLVELDNAPAQCASRAHQLKRQLVSRCVAREREIQGALYTLPDVRTKPAYPIQRVRSIIKILGDCLGILWDASVIDAELEWLSRVWASSVCVPFRDAATKNIVLASNELWLGGFSSEDARREYIYRTIEDGSCERWMEALMLDYDFCSCVHNTTPEDDVISIKYHERTWITSPVTADELVWDFTPDPQRAAITFLVRYYRFGGRKAAYRLLNPTGHRIRFRHDNDVFYFDKLRDVTKHLWPDVTSHVPGLLEFSDVLRRYLPSSHPDFDYFLATYPREKRDYYVDMYPE